MHRYATKLVKIGESGSCFSENEMVGGIPTGCATIVCIIRTGIPTMSNMLNALSDYRKENTFTLVV